MFYILFMVLAVAYNLKKFRKERDAFLSSLIAAKNPGHREMILSHHFYIFIFEGFLALIVAHFSFLGDSLRRRFAQAYPNL